MLENDKINAAAAEEGVDISVISERYTAIYYEDLEALGVESVDVAPKVTEHINEIHQMILGLIDSSHAYEAQGHVLFRVNNYDDYGQLSKRDPEELLAGARIDVAAYKENAGDFVLWKPSADDQPGWDSPWGRGRPGWHIECSAMAATHLGETIDIHGGGHDLVFPHHENERAQSTCAHSGAQYARFWVHNGFVNFDKEKMSKSLGNVMLVSDLLKTTPAEAIRYVLLSAHYRAPLDWNKDVVEQAKNSLDRLYGTLRKLGDVEVPEGIGRVIPEAFEQALLDDLNTPKALAELFILSKQANTSGNDTDKVMIKAALLQSGDLLGLLQQDPEKWFAGEKNEVDAAEIEELITQRQNAKDNKDWQLADQIRDILTEKNVVLEDGPNGTQWRIGS